MTTSLPRCASRFVFALVQLFCLIAIGGSISLLRAANAKAPVLLSELTSTRAIALESVSLKGEPFPLTMPIPFSSDPRTRDS